MESSAAISFEVNLDYPFEEAIERLTAALKEEGFG
ncbi:MAG: ABC transporter ATP-binding protein, partial [Thermoleophilia bacterium]|nr:ABC transporter ATP-binding protein [Thermoleophilia bacterium]